MAASDSKNSTWTYVILTVFALAVCTVHYCNNREQTALERMKNEEARQIKEKEITAAIEQMLISNLESTYFISHTNFTENMIFRDNLFYQKDVAKVDYGFKILESPHIQRTEEGCTLMASVEKSKHNPTNRETIKYELSHPDERVTFDVNKIMNNKLAQEEKLYDELNYGKAKENVISLFDMYAAKLGCQAKLEIKD